MTTTEQPAPVAQRHSIGSSRARWFQTSVFYEIHLPSFFRRQRDGSATSAAHQNSLPHCLRGLHLLLRSTSRPCAMAGYGQRRLHECSIPITARSTTSTSSTSRRAARRIRVIASVMNHTSSDNPWFPGDLALSPDSPKRDLYSGRTADLYQESRIIFVTPSLELERTPQSRAPTTGTRFFSHHPTLTTRTPECARLC